MPVLDPTQVHLICLVLRNLLAAAKSP